MGVWIKLVKPSLGFTRQSWRARLMWLCGAVRGGSHVDQLLLGRRPAGLSRTQQLKVARDERLRYPRHLRRMRNRG